MDLFRKLRLVRAWAEAIIGLISPSENNVVSSECNQRGRKSSQQQQKGLFWLVHHCHFVKEEMARSTSKDAQDLFHSLRSAYASTPTNLKVHHHYHRFVHWIFRFVSKLKSPSCSCFRTVFRRSSTCMFVLRYSQLWSRYSNLLFLDSLCMGISDLLALMFMVRRILLKSRIIGLYILCSEIDCIDM